MSKYDILLLSILLLVCSLMIKMSYSICIVVFVIVKMPSPCFQSVRLIRVLLIITKGVIVAKRLKNIFTTCFFVRLKVLKDQNTFLLLSTYQKHLFKAKSDVILLVSNHREETEMVEEKNETKEY